MTKVPWQKWNREIGPVPVKVFSWPRSGTHLLMATLWLNFDLGDCTGRTSEHEYAFHEMKAVDFQRKGKSIIVPWLHLFGGHTTYLTSKWLYEKQKPVPATVYIFRHPYCVLHSLWKLRNEPCSFASFAHEITVMSWLSHVREWYLSIDKRLVVRYEDLVRHPEAVVEQLTPALAPFAARRGSDVKSVSESVGWNPTTRAMDSWKDASEGDLKYIKRYLRANEDWLGYEC